MEKFVKDLFDQSDYKNLTLRIIREKYQQKKNIKELSDDQKTKLKRIVETAFANKLAIETAETGLEEPEVEKVKLNTEKHDIKKRKISQIDYSDDNDTDDDGSCAGVHCNPPPLQAKKKAKISKISSDESVDSDVNLDESDSKEHQEEDSQIKKMNSKKSSIISCEDSDSGSLNNLNKKEDCEESISGENNETEGQQTFEQNKIHKGADRGVSDSDDDSEIKDQQTTRKKKNYKSKKSSVNKKQECEDSSSDGSSEIENQQKVVKRKKNKPVKSSKKAKPKRKNEISDENVDSDVISSPNRKEDCGGPNSDVEGQQTIKKDKENKLTKSNSKCDEKSKQLKYYEKIARHCRLLPVGARYKATFEFCSNEKDKIEKIKTILKNAGMTGRISMEEAEKLKLRQEAAELNTDNIISLSGRSHRNAKSASTNSFFDCKLSTKPISEEPLKNQLGSLRDIIDSDSDD